MRSEYHVALRGMRFHALVGVLPHEREFAQPIEVDLDVWPRAADDAQGEGHLLDYRRLYELVAAVMRAGPIDYLEGLVLGVASQVLETEAVDRVRVAARKPHVALPGPLAHAEVSIDLSRHA